MIEFILKFYEKDGLLPKLLIPDDLDSTLLSNYLNIKVFSPQKEN